MLNPDNETLEWCAKWIEDSLRAETNERTIEFGRNIAMTFRAAIIPADNDYCARCGSYSLLPYHCDNCGNDLGPRPTLIPAEVQHHPRAVELLVNCAECGSILNAEICNHDERPFGKQILVTVDVRCLGCNARFGWVQTTHEEALRFWNTRAATSQPTAAPRDDAERETLIYWLLRCYQSGHREGWEAGPSTTETMDRLLDVLANRGYDPNEDEAAKELLKRKPRF
jgi:hypothetical protein